MLKVFALALALVVLLSGNAFPASCPTYGSESVAINDDASALFLNPAALGVRYGSSLVLSLARPEIGPDQYTILGSFGALGNGFVRTENGALRSKIGLRLFGEESFRVGAGLTWEGDPATGRSSTGSLDMGVLSRPCQFASFAAVGRNLNRPEFLGRTLPREYQAGMGFRPLTDRLSLFFDATLQEKQSLNKAQLKYGLEAEPADGLLVRANLDSNGNMTVGAGVNFMKASANFATAFDNDRNQTASVYTVTHNDLVNRTVLRGKSIIAHISMSGMLSDESMGGGLLGSGSQSTRIIRDDLKKAVDDPQVKGVLLRINGVGGNATIEELKDEIQKIRAAGKPVVAFLEYGGGRGDIYLASSADRIVTTEEAYFGGLGLRREMRFYRRMLGGMGIEFDRVSYGKYKSAFRNYTVDSIPDADREVINSMMDESQSLFVDAVCSERKVGKDALLPILEGQPLNAEDMVTAGLVDSIGYYNKAVSMAGNLSKLGSRPRVRRITNRQYRQYEWAIPKKIAVIYAGGTITEGRSGSDPLFGGTMGNETVIAQLKRASSMKSVKGIVLRVESRGGSGLASNLIWNEVRRIKQDTKKPIVVSMGLVAASGGYYISCPATKIFADRNTITGSIGVLTYKPSLAGLYSKLQVNEEDFEIGKYMGMNSSSRSWTDEESSLMKNSIMDFYDKFLVKVAAGRGMTKEKVDEVAQGRVWMGTQAKSAGLVDEFGGLEDAIDETRNLAGIKKTEQINIIEYRRPRGSILSRMMTDAMNEVKGNYTLEAMDGAPQYLYDWDFIFP